LEMRRKNLPVHHHRIVPSGDSTSPREGEYGSSPVAGQAANTPITN
jgi:hypothetical protein